MASTNSQEHDAFSLKAGRVILGALGAFYGFTAVKMLGDPHGFYTGIPGVDHTGPFNFHFVNDVGMAFLSAAVGHVYAALWPKNAFPALLVASVFIAGHAVVHVLDIAASRLPLDHIWLDLPVFIPAAVTVTLAVFAYRRAFG